MGTPPAVPPATPSVLDSYIKDAQSLEHLVQMVVDTFFPQFKAWVDVIVQKVDGFFGQIAPGSALPPTP